MNESNRPNRLDERRAEKQAEREERERAAQAERAAAEQARKDGAEARQRAVRAGIIEMQINKANPAPIDPASAAVMIASANMLMAFIETGAASNG